ncbi:hypothetical protein HDG35_004604 [Paraburkholderia sp. JPY681]|uniref:Uncharacterized protein n=1 Tax=Paraburkholderia atlantica TaxID=2654982 RepID=D5WGC5_PARAM|nr:conserved hypothetical protein [Paraburkholderia atlantica]MBB5508323.1 hypothetical protein [Paraburkholderia atlantica]
MAYTGKFLVNNAPLSPLTINGIGRFDAYSGDGPYLNRCAQRHAVAENLTRKTPAPPTRRARTPI